MSIEYEKKGHLVTIVLDRPEKLNAIDQSMLEALAAAWLRYEQDDDAWLAILAANGRMFCAGADKSWFERSQRGEDSLGLFLDGIGRDLFWSGRISKPSIVAVDGPVIGAGFDLVLRADLRVASTNATFRMPEVDLGSVVILWDNLPYAIAAEIAVGAEIDARRAHEIGLINRLVPEGCAIDAATKWAEELLAKPPLALQRALGVLRGIRNANSVPPTQLLRNYTTEISRSLSATEDGKESVAALLGRKKPVYRHR